MHDYEYQAANSEAHSAKQVIVSLIFPTKVGNKKAGKSRHFSMLEKFSSQLLLLLDLQPMQKDPPLSWSHTVLHHRHLQRLHHI